MECSSSPVSVAFVDFRPLSETTSCRDCAEKRNRGVMFKCHSERQAMVHAVEYLKEMCR